MQTGQDVAKNAFYGGFNCAQSVILAFCEKYGMEKETALKVTGGFGGGFRSGEICGAVSGGVAVVGLKYGQKAADDAAAKQNCNEKTIQFIEAFRKKNKFIVCREILGMDISKKDEYEQAQAKNLFKTLCADMVKSAVDTLEELGY